MNFEINKLLRENIKKLVPYSSARDEYKGKEGVFLDANENAYGAPLPENKISYNRYPDPFQILLKEKLSKMKQVSVENIFIGNGSDEAIDVLFRAFCNPGIDNVMVCPPTYGMYEVAANINDIAVLKIPLLPGIFQLDTTKILATMNNNTKLIFICCPNNPTGNGVKWDSIQLILENFKGIVVLDEAYIDFASYQSVLPKLLHYPNLVILQTFSKAWGMAGLRVGMAFASEDIIAIIHKIKAPYNVNVVSQQLALDALNNREEVSKRIRLIVKGREYLSKELSILPCVIKVYPSEANFLLVKTMDAKRIFNYLIAHKIIIRDRSNVALCEGALRITVGTEQENKQLIDALKQFK